MIYPSPGGRRETWNEQTEVVLAHGAHGGRPGFAQRVTLQFSCTILHIRTIGTFLPAGRNDPEHG